MDISGISASGISHIQANGLTCIVFFNFQLFYEVRVMDRTIDPLNFQGNVQVLIDIIKTTESVNYKNFDMGDWMNDCNTKGCMIGHYMYEHGSSIISDNDINYLGSDVSKAFLNIANKLKISHKESSWLFGCNHLSFKGRPYSTVEKKRAALKRLRTFLYYKLHKMDILSDYEWARHAEGNHFVNNKVTKSVTQKEFKGELASV